MGLEISRQGCMLGKACNYLKMEVEELAEKFESRGLGFMATLLNLGLIRSIA